MKINIISMEKSHKLRELEVCGNKMVQFSNINSNFILTTFRMPNHFFFHITYLKFLYDLLGFLI